MSDLNSLKKRKNSIISTQKITNAVQNISSVRLTKLKKIVSVVEENKNLCLSMKYKVVNMNDTDTLFVFGSDRGLCGNFNLVLFKKFLSFKAENDMSKFKVFVFGKKMHEHFKNDKFDGAVFCYYKKNFDDTISEVFECLKDGPRVHVLYQKFVNVLLQKPTYIDCQNPVIADDVEGGDVEVAQEIDDRDYSMSYFAAIFSYAINNSFASEESARMNLMDNATKNAKDLTRSLSLKINRIRQTSITNQLIEIISGIESLKKS